MSRRKLGSSRKNKGKQLAKDPETEPYLETREDFEEETSGNKTLETQATQLEFQDELTQGTEHGMSQMHDSTLFSGSSPEYCDVKNAAVNPEDVESFMSETGSLQTCKIDSKLKETDTSNSLEREEVKESTPVDGLSEALDSSISPCASVDQQLTNNQAANSSMHAAAKSESNKRDDTDLFRQDGSLQGNHMASESQISSVFSKYIKPETTTDKSSPSEKTVVKHNVGQALLLLPEEELPTIEELDDFAQHSEDGENKVHDEDHEPTQMQGLISTPDAKQDIYPKESDFMAVNQRNKVDHLYVLKQTGNNTDTGKTDVGQMYEGGVHVEDDVKQSVEQTVHQERDLFEAERINSSPQTLPSETRVHFDSQHQDRSLKVNEQAGHGFGHIGNKRKFGSRRSNKGKQHLKESEEEVLEHDEDDQPLEQENIVEPSTTSQEELNQHTGHDIILSESHVISLTAPNHSVDVQSSSPEKYTVTDPEHFILKSENLPEDQNERETEINVDVSSKLEVMSEKADKSDTLYSEDTRRVHFSEDVGEVQEVLQTNNSSEAAIDDANLEISGSLINQFEVTNQSDPTEESTDDSATKQEFSTLVVNPNNFATTEIMLEAVDQRNKDNPVNDLNQTCIINTECIETTGGQKHEDVKHNPEQSIQQYEDRVFESQTSNILPQTLPLELNALPDSQFQDNSVSMDEPTHTGFSQTGNSGTSHSEDVVEKVQEHELNPAQMQEIVQSDCSPATLPDDAPVNLEITSEIVTDHAKINNAHQSEFTEKSTDDSTTKEAASNLEDEPYEYSTKQDISEALDLRNEDWELYSDDKPQISDVENSAPGQMHGFKGRVEEDVEPNTDQIFHQEEGPLCETEDMKPVGYQPQDSSEIVSENSHTDFHHRSNRRKMGSSRRNKGKHKLKESIIETYHKTGNESDANLSSNKSSEAVLTVEMAGQEKSVEIFQEEEEKTATQTEMVNFDTLVYTPELLPTDVQSTSTEDQSVFEKSRHRQMPDEDFPITDTVSEEILDCTELLRQDGNLQNYLVCEQLAHPITQEIHSEKSNSGEYAKDECRIGKGSPEDELHTKEEQLNKVTEARQSEDAVKKEHGQEIEPTKMQGMSQTDYTIDKSRDDTAADAEFAMKRASDTKPHISDTERLENELGDVYEVQGPVTMNLSVDEIGHQVKEDLLFETGDTESSLQSLQHETHSVLDHQSQHNDTSLSCGRNNEAVGSSQEKPMEIKLEGMDKSDTFHTDNTAVHGTQLGTVAGINEFTTSSPSVKQQLIKSNSGKLPDDKLPSVSTAKEITEPDEDTEKLGPCGNLKGNHLSSENVEFSIPPQRTTEKSCQKDQTEVESNVEQETFLSQENFTTNRTQDEHFNLSKAEEALHSEDVVTKKNDEHVNQTQMHQIMITGEQSTLQTLQSARDPTPLETQTQDSCQSFEDESCLGVKLAGNRRKLGSSRRDKTKQQAKISEANQESKVGVVEDTEMLAASTTKQEELEDLISAEKVKISSTMSGDENMEELLNVIDNSAVTTPDINPGTDKGDSLKFIKDLDERHTTLVKEPDNLSELTGHDTVNLMQSPQVCAGKDESDVQSISYHDDIISPGSGILHVLDQEAAFQCQNTEVSSCDKDSQGQEVHLQQTDNVTETVRCVTITDCYTEVESSMDAQGPEQDEAGEKHVHAVQEMDTSQESAVGMSDESGISTPEDVRNSLQEKPQSDDNENLQVKSKEKRRKMGSSRKMRFNRKQEEDTDRKERDFEEVEVRDLDKLEAVEEFSITAEVLQSEHAQPLQSTLEQEKPKEKKNFHHEEHKQQSCTFDKQSNKSNVTPAFLSEQSTSINPAALKMAAADERDEERNVDKKAQLDDYTNTETQFTSVATETNNSASSQLLPPDTETNIGMSKQTHVESVKPEVQDADGQKPSNLHEETKLKNLEVRSTSPDLNSPNRRRKLGSTRKSLSSRTRREGLNQKQELENKPAETASTGENIMAERDSRIEEKDLQLHAEHKDNDSEQRKDNAFEAAETSHVGGSLTKPLIEKSAEESPVSQSQVTETENRLTPETELTPSTSPKNDAQSELVSEGRRRKLGSNRKSRLHQSNKTQSARGARMMDAQNENDVIEEDAHEAAEERREKSTGLDKRSEVDESDEKALGFSVSKSASEKTPVQSEISFGQESQRELSFADPRKTDLRSNCYNVVMVGDSCVGKTSFMKRAQSGKFSLDLPASVGLDSCMWTVLVEGKPVVLQLWDTAGQERFRSITRQIFHKAHAFLLMYDITSSQSFSAVSYWANSIQEAAAENVTVLLLGNKSDHPGRQVNTEQGEILAKEYNYEFLECSAATGENVIQALEIVARMLSQRADFREEATVLHKEPAQKKRSTCC